MLNGGIVINGVEAMIMSTVDVRAPAVAGRFYPASPEQLSSLVEGFLAEVDVERRPGTGAIVPHAGILYSGACAAQVFGRLSVPPIIVILAPNHTGAVGARGGASVWSRGAFETPLGRVSIAEGFAEALMSRCDLAEHDPDAHWNEHAIEVELPFVRAVAPASSIVPIVLAWDDWDRSRRLAEALATTVKEWPEDVLLVASSDMSHFESAVRAKQKDSLVFSAIEELDAQKLLATCESEHITMCGRAPAAVVIEASRWLGATSGELVDYRHSGLVTGDDSSVVSYAGVIIR
jgi:AmmeMemoRadiSam system protein B